MITVNGKKYKVVENLGFQGGHMTKEILVDGEEKVVIKVGGLWRFWDVEDRLHFEMHE